MRKKRITILFFLVFCVVLAADASNRNSKFSSDNHAKSRSGSKFSTGGIVANGVGNGTGAGGGNGGSGTGVDNGNGNPNGGPVPISSGLWMLLVGSAFYLGRRVYTELK